jgi:hypothetical protein
MNYCAVILRQGRKMLHNIQESNIDHLGAALVTVLVALFVLKMFSNKFVHIVCFIC